MAVKILAVIVTYHPCPQILQRQLDALLPQVTGVVIVDNASSEDKRSWLRDLSLENDAIHLIELVENLGIAKAQNDGIIWAKTQAAHFVLLMDQDSQPAYDMVGLLFSAYENLVSLGKQVSAIGPKFVDIDSGKVSKHVRFGKLSVARVECDGDQRTIPVDFLIASGSLISINVLDQVGLMDESLFIDHVDTEWILRAQSKGYMAFGHCQALMLHSLGEHRIRFWLGRWRDVPIHKPFRYYYIFRNSILLHKRDYMGWHWRWVDLIRLLQVTVFMGIVANERRKKMKMIWKGIIAGIRGETGKMPN
ncbi:MAG: glycosyltransferase family 2 protein [Gammaproteobacteria bacterium]|nr:glycosyltransferase family 2 protein [Gammaproteobacteria bacterium]